MQTKAKAKFFIFSNQAKNPHSPRLCGFESFIFDSLALKAS